MSDLVVLTGVVGVGAGVVAGGRLLRGARGFAGEVGHLQVDPGGRRCGCGRRGCWETVAGLDALLVAPADPADPGDPVRDLALLGPRLAEPLAASLPDRVLAPQAGGCRVEPSGLGFTAAARGGALEALTRIFDDPTAVTAARTTAVGAGAPA